MGLDEFQCDLNDYILPMGTAPTLHVVLPVDHGVDRWIPWDTDIEETMRLNWQHVMSEGTILALVCIRPCCHEEGGLALARKKNIL